MTTATPSSASARARLQAWLAALPPARSAALAHEFAGAAFAAGAYVSPPAGPPLAIPLIFTPAAVQRASLDALAADAHLLTRALVRLSMGVLGGARIPALGEGATRRLFAGFSALERQALTRFGQAQHLATVRVDFLHDPAGRPHALEVNATIPAMQGYSDVVAESFLRQVAAERRMVGTAVDSLVDANGRNTQDLLESLLAHHLRLGGERREGLGIAIVARAGDAQIGELTHYSRRWSERGHRVILATPDELSIEAGRALARGVAVDLIYRHIFARRIDPASEFATMCLEAEHFHVLNPIASHLEVKGMLAWLSAAASDDVAAAVLGLGDDERDTIFRIVPWTRVLEPGQTRGPTGEPIEDLPAFAAAHAGQLVVKRSWDYGGKTVFVGVDMEEPGAQARLRSLLGRSGAVSFGDLVEFAAADPSDAWVVQELVPTRRQPELCVTPAGLEQRALHLDLSVFTNAGVEPRPRGGAVRAAEGRIVNILGGGGLAPLIYTEVLEQLLSGGPS